MNLVSPLFLLILCVVGVILLIFLRRKFKPLNLPNVFLVTGGVKTGKTFFSVYLAVRQYKKNLFQFRIKKFFATLIGLGFKYDNPPMLYSNIHLAKVVYNPLTLDILRRKVRIPDKSVVLLDEFSLIADSMLFKDSTINNDLMAFFKLFGHYSHGGTCVVDTQSPSDLHYSAKRTISSNIFIARRVKFPFVSLLEVREMLFTDDKNVVNAFNEDTGLSARKVLVPNYYYKRYDQYCYSSFTDFKPLQVVYDVEKKSLLDDLKCYDLVSFQDFAKIINKELKIYKSKLDSESECDDNEEEN